MRSPTQRAFSYADAVTAAKVAFGEHVTQATELSGGSFGTVWRVDLADGRETVLKVGPDPAARLLRYEAGMLACEADYLRLVESRAPGVPGPRLLHEGGDWLFMTLVPGTPLYGLPEAVDSAPARFSSGAAIARLHGVTGEFFGYPGDRAHADTWPEAYAGMLDALLADAVDWGVELPVEPETLRRLVSRHHDVLAAVTTPVLLHFDLWDGNVLTVPGAPAAAGGDDPHSAGVRRDGGTALLSGIVDGERYLWGDPMIDFASPWLLRDIFADPEHPFVRGYQSVRPFTVDPQILIRYGFAQLYLYLLMVVEVPSRGMGPDEKRWRDEHCGVLVKEIAARLAAA